MARVKRRGKSPPPAAQASGHGKPHRVQGQIGDPGAARSKAQAGSRVSAAQINDPLRRATGEDRTRLTALSRLHYFAGFDRTGLPLRSSVCGVDCRESEHPTVLIRFVNNSSGARLCAKRQPQQRGSFCGWVSPQPRPYPALSANRISMHPTSNIRRRTSKGRSLRQRRDV